MLGAKKVIRNGKTITYYGCGDCGLVYGNACQRGSMRPNNKFCDKECMAFVLEEGLQLSGKRPRGWKDWVNEHDNSELLQEKD